MSTYTQIFYHIVFSTKGRTPVLLPAGREDLFRFIWGLVRSRNCRLHQINAANDHVHMLTTLHPSWSLADFMREIKVTSSHWIKANNVFNEFPGWQAGYGAFTRSKQDTERLIHYIKQQEEHHQKISFAEELRNLIVEAGIEFDEKYLLG
jgi:REP element-mobilizing transposase RayT